MTKRLLPVAQVPVAQAFQPVPMQAKTCDNIISGNIAALLAMRISFNPPFVKGGVGADLSGKVFAKDRCNANS